MVVDGNSYSSLEISREFEAVKTWFIARVFEDQLPVRIHRKERMRAGVIRSFLLSPE
jgi:hypothetical protein